MQKALERLMKNLPHGDHDRPPAQHTSGCQQNHRHQAGEGGKKKAVMWTCWRAAERMPRFTGKGQKKRPPKQAARNHGDRVPRSLIVLPDDSSRPILDAIRGATKLASHQDVCAVPIHGYCEPLLQAHKRSVRVRVMSGVRTAARGRDENDASRRVLRRYGGIEVLDTSPAFDDHARKIHDCRRQNRVRAIPQLDAAEFQEDPRLRRLSPPILHGKWRRSSNASEADFGAGKRSRLCQKRSHLIWCPQEGRERIVSFIDFTEAFSSSFKMKDIRMRSSSSISSGQNSRGVTEGPRHVASSPFSQGGKTDRRHRWVAADARRGNHDSQTEASEAVTPRFCSQTGARQSSAPSIPVPEALIGVASWRSR